SFKIHFWPCRRKRGRPTVRSLQSTTRSSARSGDRDHEPEPCPDLNQEIKCKGGPVSGFGIVALLGDPELNHHACHILHHKRATDVKDIERGVGASGKLFRKIVGEDRVAKDGRRADRGHDCPRKAWWQRQSQDQCQLSAEEHNGDKPEERSRADTSPTKPMNC